MSMSRAQHLVLPAMTTFSGSPPTPCGVHRGPDGPSSKRLPGFLAALEAAAISPPMAPFPRRKSMISILKMAAAVLAAASGLFYFGGPHLAGAPVAFEGCHAEAPECAYVRQHDNGTPQCERPCDRPACCSRSQDFSGARACQLAAQ